MEEINELLKFEYCLYPLLEILIISMFLLIFIYLDS